MKKVKHIVFDHDGTLIDTTQLDKALFPGIKDMLTELKELGAHLYVWTARGRQSASDILSAQGVLSYFDSMVCGGEAPQKPDITGLQEMLYDIDPEEVIILGDSLGDIIGGKSLGAVSLGALWAHGSDEASGMYYEYGAKRCFLSIEECREYICDLVRGE